MLEIRLIDKEKNNKEITDIELEFRKIELKKTPLVEKFLQEIELARYNDEHSFIDRFGYKLRKNCLSTGCKAAILLSEVKDRELNLIGCGYNVVESIVRNIKQGKIQVNSLYDMSPYSEDYIGDDIDDMDIEIDVGFEGYRFSNLWRLNYYLKEECEGYADMNIPGIERIQDVS